MADIELRGRARADRPLDRQRSVTVKAELQRHGRWARPTKAVNDLPIMKHLPAGVQPATQPATRRRCAELFGGFVIACSPAIVLIYAVLVLLFRSFFKPIDHPLGPAAGDRRRASGAAADRGLSAVDARR